MKLTGTTDFTFEPISAADLNVTESEKQRCREWFDTNIRTTERPAFDFTVGTCSLQKNIADWDISVGTESSAGSVYRGGKTTLTDLKHKKSGLTAQVEATIYEDLATCEWTVRVTNGGDTESPVIKDFNAADFRLDTGLAELYVSKGSNPAADDFQLIKSAVCPTPMTFNANGGRSESWLPYFNICGAEFGAVVAVGWTGQWFASVRQAVRGVALKAKQEFFKAPLKPGETVRSPLISLTFYENKNAIKGFETFRRFEKDCVIPDSVKPMKGYVIANEFSKLTCDDFIARLGTIDPRTLTETDYFWMDAGWYEYNEGWHDGVGNWIPDKSRFPEGLKPLGDAIAALDKRFLLWYEPERVREGTVLYNEGVKHDDWILQIDDNLMWNLANNDARDYLIDMIAGSLRDNGVTMYRQDFNFTPLEYWKKADKEFYGERTGIAENHYVTNLYAYLDALIESVPGLVIDNCASGGKRLDLEMSRRSIPLWRSDYNCGNEDGTVKDDVLEATQSMTHGLSFWLPYSGTNQYYHSIYAIRSAVLTHLSVYEPEPVQFAAYDTVREHMTKNYFPLTNGGLETNKILAMQFGDKNEGTALIYVRENVKTNSFTLRLNGLDPQATYKLTDMDDPGFACSASGQDLMEAGVKLTVSEKPAAMIIGYQLTVYG